MLAVTSDTDEAARTLTATLVDNGFKPCAVSARIMLTEMVDKGLPENVAAFFETVALTRLPYLPADVK